MDEAGIAKFVREKNMGWWALRLTRMIARHIAWRMRFGTEFRW